jgi:hypothetical protein
MFFITDMLVVFGSLVGGYLDVLWQPLEFLIIGGASIGVFVIGNSLTVLKGGWARSEWCLRDQSTAGSAQPMGNKRGCRMATEGKPLQRWHYLVMIAMDLKAI